MTRLKDMVIPIHTDASALREAIEQMKRDGWLAKIKLRNGTSRPITIEALKGEKRIMKLTLKSGAVVEGTGDEIAALLSKGVEPAVSDLEDSLLFYRSDSKGAFLPIATMDINHIRNAMLKRYREWAENLRDLWGDELVETIAAGPVDDKQFQGLYRAYVARHYSEEL